MISRSRNLDNVYKYIHCQDARDLDIIVFCFLFLVFFVCLLLHIVLNFSLKLCTT